jgi:ferredoxin/flavodoxin---NADP+ reductase
LNKIIKKKKLTEDIYEFEVEAPVIAGKAKPGQFVIIRISEKGERIPLTIADSDPAGGTISLVELNAGKSTCMLSGLGEGNEILDVIGPLGKETEIAKFGKVILAGGGVGIAPIYPIAKALKQSGNYIISVLGAKNKDNLIFIDKLGPISDELYLCSDDGSIGFKGFISNFMAEFLRGNNQKNATDIERTIAIGPVLMMRSVCEVTRQHNIKTVVSLNSIMVDGTGMCGACRVEIGGMTKFACVDGPEFDGHLVNFELLLSRQKIYLNEEKISMDLYLKDHECKITSHTL